MLTFFSFFVALLCTVDCFVFNETDDGYSQFATFPPITTNHTKHPDGTADTKLESITPHATNRSEQLGSCTTHRLDGYVPSPEIGSAHKLHLWNLPWNNARRACSDEGGHLTIINSDLERDILCSMMKANKVDSVWLGIHGLYESNDWTTITGIPLGATGFSGWNGGEPNNAHGKEHCGELSAAGPGGMNDIGCDNRRSFICEIPITTQY